MSVEGAMNVLFNASQTALQGWSKVQDPGSVNMRRTNCVFLPAVGRLGILTAR